MLPAQQNNNYNNIYLDHADWHKLFDEFIQKNRKGSSLYDLIAFDQLKPIIINFVVRQKSRATFDKIAWILTKVRCIQNLKANIGVFCRQGDVQSETILFSAQLTLAEMFITVEEFFDQQIIPFKYWREIV